MAAHTEVGIEFRRRPDGEVWHWCLNCSHWPTRDYQTRHGTPPRDELCSECQAKTEAGSCRG